MKRPVPVTQKGSREMCIGRGLRRQHLIDKSGGALNVHEEDPISFRIQIHHDVLEWLTT